MTEKCYIIPVQKRCNCDCTFCISKSRNYNKKEEFLVLNNTLKNNLLSLKKHCIKKFEITGGGEPLLNKDIQGIIDLIKDIIPNSYIKLYTNGYIMKKINNIDELNISVVHYDENINSKFMNPNISSNIIDKLEYYKANMPNTKIRLSIPLIIGGIDNKEKLDQFINLTSKYVSNYVIRTLYPKTKEKDNFYVDFAYNHSKVTIERDNDVTEFNGFIMWSDSKIYSNWELNKEANLNTGYILLKPDSQTYINEIERLILLKEFIILKKYLITDFKNNSINLYNDKLDDIEYYKKIKRHLENISYLFGNNGVLLMLTKSELKHSLAKQLSNLKMDIRNQYSFTGNKNGYIKVEDNISHLNMVHIPDDYLCNERDIKVLDDKKILDYEISEVEWQNIKKYKSYGGIK